VKLPSCTVTSAPDTKVWSVDYSARLPEGRRSESGPPRVGSGSGGKNYSFCSSPSIINPLNAKLNPICHLLALLGAHHILHVSRIRVKIFICSVTAVFVKLKCRCNLKYWQCLVTSGKNYFLSPPSQQARANQLKIFTLNWKDWHSFPFTGIWSDRVDLHNQQIMITTNKDQTSAATFIRPLFAAAPSSLALVGMFCTAVWRTTLSSY